MQATLDGIKLLIFQKKNKFNLGNIVEDSIDIYHIPFVRDSQNYVNASMIITATPTDTTISYKIDIQYLQQQNTNTSISDSAEYFAVYFMFLDNTVFGYNKFKILDTNLFKSNNKKAEYVTIDSMDTGNNSNVWSLITTCINISVTQNSCPYASCSGPNGTCDNCNLCTSTTSYSFCSSNRVEGGGSGNGSTGNPPSGYGNPTGGNGGGTPIGGGSNTGGSGNSPNNVGWIPITIIDDDIVVLAIDSIPQVLSTLCTTQMDSLYQWGISNGFREQSFIIVVKDGIKYPKNFTPGFPTGDKTRVNYTLAAGEQLIAYVHTHAEDTVGYYRTSFSPQDLIEFNKNANTIGYTSLLEVGNARYAFVLEDIPKKNAFNISKQGRHVQLFIALLNTLTSITNGQTKTEQAWMQYLGSASISGIGFYKSSTKRDKNVFTKLNP